MSNLTAHAVRRVPPPRYPTRLEVWADPALLRRHVPPAWLARGELAGAVGLVVAMQAGCSRGQPVDGTATDAEAAAGAPQPTVVEMPAGAAPRSVRAAVAPLFRHGDGKADAQEPRKYAMLACVAVAAPFYLTEEEALLVIAEELAAAGLIDLARNEPLPQVVIAGHEVVTEYDLVADRHRSRLEPVRRPLVVDLFDAERRIAIEYVAVTDFLLLGGRDNGAWTAELTTVVGPLNRAVHDQAPDVWFASVYDPVVWESFDGFASTRDNGPGDRVPAAELARQRLRDQVKDFVDWLRGQGVI
jgi:hypothetical protein